MGRTGARCCTCLYPMLWHCPVTQISQVPTFLSQVILPSHRGFCALSHQSLGSNYWFLFTFPALFHCPPQGLAGDWGWKNCPSSFGAERQRRNGQPKLSFQNLITDPNPSLASSDFSSYNDQRQKAKTWDPQPRTKFSTLDMQPLERAFVFLKAVPQRQTSAFKL